MSSYVGRVCKIIGILLSTIAILISLSGMAGWFFDIPELTEFKSQFISMKFNTALGIFFLSTAILAGYIRNSYKAYIRFSILLTFLIGMLSITEDISGFNFGIDELFFKDLRGLEKGEKYPGRLSPITSICFILCSSGIWIASTGNPTQKKTGQVVLGVTTIFSFVTMIGYLFEAPSLTHLNFTSPIAMPTAIAIFCISVSGSLLNPDIGYLSIFTGSKIGNIMTRKLLLQIIAATLILGYLRLLAYKYNLFSNQLALALTILVFILIVCILVSSIASRLNAIEDSRAYSELKFSKVIESTPNGIIIVDSEGKIEMVNAQCEELFGYNKTEMLGNSIEILIPHQFRETHKLHRKEYLKESTKRRMGGDDNLFALHKNGSELPVEVGLNTVKTEHEKIMIASVIDVSERINKQKIINEQFSQLQLKNREIEEFAFIASHDLQEPLRTIRNYITMISEDYPELDAEVILSLESMDNAAERMGKLIKCLLEYGKLGTRGNTEVINMRELIQEVLSDVKSLINQKRAIVKIETDLPEIIGYKTELRQLLQNLIHNGIKFSRQDEAPVISIGYTAESLKPHFYVKDNGIGIEAKHFDKVFKIFRKLNQTEQDEGFGVGLANCKKIIELHKGDIWIESEPGAGSVFKFTILN
jgi:PAS domain S-box-containing protein